MLEANKVRRGRQGERVWLGGGARGLPCRGGGVCEYENDEKSGGSEAWTVTREEGKLVFVLGTPG